MLYVAIYFGMGAFLVLVALVHKSFERDKTLVAAIAILMLWPLILLAGPEILISQRKRSEAPITTSDFLKDQLTVLLTSSNDLDLSAEEMRRLRNVAQYGYNRVQTFPDGADFQDALSKLWSITLPPEIYYHYRRAISRLQESDDNRDPDEMGILLSVRRPEWYVGFSNEFVKSIARIDKKVQGRILEALSKISSAPVQQQGDTIKPLTNDLKGLWRYRIGDDRLVYFPDFTSKTIVLVSFASRSGVYGDLPDVSSLLNRSKPTNG